MILDPDLFKTPASEPYEGEVQLTMAQPDLPAGAGETKSRSASPLLSPQGW